VVRSKLFIANKLRKLVTSNTRSFLTILSVNYLIIFIQKGEDKVKKLIKKHIVNNHFVMSIQSC